MSKWVDIDASRKTIKRFIAGHLMRTATNGYVVGLSGGIDSALSTALAVDAVGPDKVLAIMLPYRSSHPDSVDDARLLAEQLGIESRQIDISPMIDAYYTTIDESNRLRAGNKMARERMSILFDISHQTGRLVLGTGNRTEICLGYTTWYGDAACSINPIGELYKTEVRLMAEELNLPASIIKKAPSADLWENQTDEAEIGVTYEQIDLLLKRIVDEDERSMAVLEQEGFSPTDISRVVSLTNRFYFKRELPDIAPLGKPSIPRDIVLTE